MTYYGIGVDGDWLFNISQSPEGEAFMKRVRQMKGMVGVADRWFHNYAVILFTKRIEAECARIRLSKEYRDRIYLLVVKAEGDEIKNDY